MIFTDVAAARCRGAEFAVAQLNLPPASLTKVSRSFPTASVPPSQPPCSGWGRSLSRVVFLIWLLCLSTLGFGQSIIHTSNWAAGGLSGNMDGWLSPGTNPFTATSSALTYGSVTPSGLEFLRPTGENQMASGVDIFFNNDATGANTNQPQCIFRYSGSGTFYWCSINFNHLTINSSVSGSSTNLGTSPAISLSTSTTYDLYAQVISADSSHTTLSVAIYNTTGSGSSLARSTQVGTTFTVTNDTTSGLQLSAQSTGGQSGIAVFGTTSGPHSIYELITWNPTTSSPATAYTMEGPSGQAGAVIFTFQPNGYLANAVNLVITPSDGSAGGKWTPSTLTFTGNGSTTNASQVATYLPPTTTSSVNLTASHTYTPGGIADPSSIGYTSTAWITSDNSNFIYNGRWQLSGSGALAQQFCINAGCQVVCSWTGSSTSSPTINLLFQVGNQLSANEYPDLVYSLDGGPWTRFTVPASGIQALTLPTVNGNAFTQWTSHTLTLTVEGLDSGNSASVVSDGDLWTLQQSACVFLGLVLDSGATMITPSVSPNWIEFVGDSNEDTYNCLSISGNNITNEYAHGGWPMQIANFLGLRPFITAFPSQGIYANNPGSPFAPNAFGNVPTMPTTFLYTMQLSGTLQAWNPVLAPTVIVLDGSSNDQTAGVSTTNLAIGYNDLLNAIRTKYGPSPVIECLGLPGQSTYETTIASVVSARGDSRIFFDDYTNGFFLSADFIAAGNPHYNISGQNKLAASLSHTIAGHLSSLGIRVQASGGGGNFANGHIGTSESPIRDNYWEQVGNRVKP